MEKFNWEKYKNLKLDYDKIKVDIKHFTDTEIKMPKINDFIKNSVERLSEWIIKLSILSCKTVSVNDIVQTWSSDERSITYSFTITKEDLQNAIELYSQHKNADIMLKEFFKLYNEIIDKNGITSN